jgi:SAM-dependent methyltransferase
MKKYHNNHQTLESMSQAVWYNRWTLGKFAPYLYGDILEVGCGIGNFTKTLTSFGLVWAFDNDADCVRRTIRLVGKSAKVDRGDIEKKKYAFGNKKFDCIVCLNVLEHIENDQQAIKNMTELLKPHGALVILVPIFDFLYGSIDASIHHFRRYDKDSLLQLLSKEHMEIKLARRLNFFGAIGWWFAGRVLKTTTVRRRQLFLFNKIAPYILPMENVIEPPIGTSVLVVAQKVQT